MNVGSERKEGERFNDGGKERWKMEEGREKGVAAPEIVQVCGVMGGGETHSLTSVSFHIRWL